MNEFDLKSWVALSFGYTGEITPAQYWRGLVIPGLLAIPYALLFPVSQTDSLAYVVTTFLLLIIAWSWMALGAKRLRNRKKSPFWLALGLIPIFGIILLTIELGFFPARE
jgi:uncharacterized membrane protein YhaH (DUF805 family)